MLLDPRTKLLILSITSISVFLNESIDSAAAGDIEIARYVRGHHIYV